MLKRDFLQAEIEKLNQIFAKILGLKDDGKYAEANDLINNTLNNDLNIQLKEISTIESIDLKSYLTAKKLSAQKLDLLAKFLLAGLPQWENDQDTIRTLGQVNSIYELLEQQHHWQSLENIQQQQKILLFLHKINYGQP